MRAWIGWSVSVVAVLALALTAVPTRVLTQAGRPQEEALPTRVVIEVDNAERALYRIAIPDLIGNTTEDAAPVIRNDLKLSSLFSVLDQRSFIADLSAEGLGITTNPWSVVGANGVVKGKVVGNSVELRLYELARGETAILTKTYNGGAAQMRGFMHDFANEILRVLTGKAGSFGSRLTFARRLGPGRKDVFISDFDGHNVGRVSGGQGISMLPNFGPGGIWFSVLSDTGMFITHSKAGGRPLIGGSGLNMGVSLCGGRAYFSSTRDGNSDIYSSALDGTDVRRLTRDAAIDVSPACGPGGKIAFVSSRHGGPQIFVMGSDGSSPRRVTYRGAHNQTPAWCPDPAQPLIAFTGRDGGGLDIFTVNISTGATTRLTQGQGVNKDPAFSPDCRMVAFASSRGGIFISNPEGLNQNLVVPGAAETIRWSR